MKVTRLALTFVTILSIVSIASIAQAISVVLVTDDAGMHALADSDNRGLIRGTVSSVDSKQYGGGPPVVYLHFAGVKNDHVFAAITDPMPWQNVYGRDLSGFVGKTVEIMSKAAEEDSGKIHFGTAFYSDLRVVESGSKSPETASIPAAPSGSASSATSGTSKGHSTDAGTIAKLEKMGNDGNMEAQEELGSIYLAGYGTIAKDSKKAVFWFQKAVDQNNSPTANMLLARMYENGWGVDQDTDLAFGYYENIERSPGNQALKKAIAPEWTKVQKEKQASSEASSHVDYVDAAGKLHPAGASYPHSHPVEDRAGAHTNNVQADPQFLTKVYNKNFGQINEDTGAHIDIISVSKAFRDSGCQINDRSGLDDSDPVGEMVKIQNYMTGDVASLFSQLTPTADVWPNYVRAAAKIDSSGGCNGAWSQRTLKNLAFLIRDRADNTPARNWRDSPLNQMPDSPENSSLSSHRALRKKDCDPRLDHWSNKQWKMVKGCDDLN
jgi:hypothetical protein